MKETEKNFLKTYYENMLHKAIFYHKFNKNLVWITEPKIASTYTSHFGELMKIPRFIFGEWLTNKECKEPNWNDPNLLKLILIREPVDKCCSAQMEELVKSFHYFGDNSQDTRSLIIWCSVKRYKPVMLKEFLNRLRSGFYSQVPMLDKNEKSYDETTRVGIEYIYDFFRMPWPESLVFHEEHTYFRLSTIWKYFKCMPNVKFIDIKDLDKIESVNYIDSIVPGWKDYFYMVKYRITNKDDDLMTPVKNHWLQSVDSTYRYRQNHVTEQVKSLLKINKFKKLNFMDNIVDNEFKIILNHEIETYDEIKNSDYFLKF